MCANPQVRVGGQRFDSSFLFFFSGETAGFLLSTTSAATATAVAVGDPVPTGTGKAKPFTWLKKTRKGKRVSDHYLRNDRDTTIHRFNTYFVLRPKGPEFFSFQRSPFPRKLFAFLPAFLRFGGTYLSSWSGISTTAGIFS